MPIGKQEEIQCKKTLRAAAISQWSKLHAYLAENPEADNYTVLEKKDHALIEEIYKLQLEEVRLLGVQAKTDVEEINKAVESISAFLAKIKRVEKSISVITAVIAFVGAAIAKDPKAMAAAGKVLYKAIETFNKEEGDGKDEKKDKGNDKDQGMKKSNTTQKAGVVSKNATGAQ